MKDSTKEERNKALIRVPEADPKERWNKKLY